MLLEMKGEDAWDFRGKVGNSQVNEKEEACDKQILAGAPETTGHSGE